MAPSVPDVHSQELWQTLQHLRAQYVERLTKVKWKTISDLAKLSNQKDPELEKRVKRWRDFAEEALTVLQAPDPKTAALLRQSLFPKGLAHFQKRLDSGLSAWEKKQKAGATSQQVREQVATSSETQKPPEGQAVGTHGIRRQLPEQHVQHQLQQGGSEDRPIDLSSPQPVPQPQAPPQAQNAAHKGRLREELLRERRRLHIQALKKQAPSMAQSIPPKQAQQTAPQQQRPQQGPGVGAKGTQKTALNRVLHAFAAKTRLSVADLVQRMQTQPALKERIELEVKKLEHRVAHGASARSSAAAPPPDPKALQQTALLANVPPATSPATHAPPAANPRPPLAVPPPSQTQPLPPLPPQVVGYLQGLTLKQLQAYLAKLRERLADEERPQEDAPLASNVLRLGRIRLLRQQIASCQQHVQELEGRGGTVGASGAGVVAPSLIGAGRAMNGPGRGATGVESGVNEVGRGVNGTGGGITGAGNNLNGSGAGSHIAGRGANGSGRGVNGAGRGLNGVGGGVYGAGGGVNGSGRGMNGAGRGVNEAGEGGDGGVTGTGEGVNEIGRGVNGGGQRVIRIRRGVNGAGRGQPAEADAGGGGGAVSSSVPGGSFDGVDLTRGTLNGLGEGKTIAMRMREVGLGVNRVTAPDAVRTGSAGVAETGAGRRSVNWNRVSGANANTSGEIGASKAKPPNLDVNERSAGATTRHGVNGASQGSAAVDNCLDCGRAVVPDVNRDHVDGATADGYSVNGDGGKGVVRLASVNRPGQGASTRERGGPIQIMPPVLPDSAGRRTPANPGGVVGAPNVPPANGGPQASVQRGARPLPKAVKVFRTVTMNGKAKTVEQVLTDPQQIAALYQRLEGRRAAGGAERSAREGTERGAAQRVEGQAGPPRDTEPGAAQRTGEAADSPQQMEARGEGTAMLRRDNKRKLSATGMDIGTTEELEGGRMGQPLAEGGVQGLQLLPRLESGPPEKKLKAQVEELSARLGGADAFANAPSKLGHTRQLVPQSASTVGAGEEERSSTPRQDWPPKADADLNVCAICEEEWDKERRRTVIIPAPNFMCGHALYCNKCLEDFFERMSEKAKSGAFHYECPSKCNLGPERPRLMPVFIGC